METNQLFKCDGDDIELIYYHTYELTCSHILLKSSSTNTNEIISDNKLNIELFNAFIKLNFDIVNTISYLKCKELKKN